MEATGGGATSGGEIPVDGGVANRSEPKERNVTMALQNGALYPHVSMVDM